MKSLVVNAGSSSLKLSVFEGPKRILEAHFKNLNSEHALLDVHPGASSEHQGPLTIRQALQVVLKMLSIQPECIGHRVVHGGPRYKVSVRIDDAVLSYLDSISPLAPLHNPACLEGIRFCREYFGDKIPQVAVFDTAFHRTMPPHASLYAISPELGVERFGFHGISHAYLWQAYLQNSIYANKESRIITLHLGNGCSAAAIRGGISLDTSMGFTPAEGLVMGTRAGDIDAAVVGYLCSRDNLSVSDVMELLNSQSGLLGVSGTSSDMKSLLEQEQENQQAKLAIDLFCYRVLKYVGAYTAVLGGLNAIVFAGGIGESAWAIRERLCTDLYPFRISVDAGLNKHAVGLSLGDIRRISPGDSEVEVFVVATDENAFIAQEVQGQVLR
ncbi:MAG: acetate/propionate family kinase [Chlamydiales bacterium]|nr:acetate/propionate family kinase [Chlamydiales bacterium]